MLIQTQHMAAENSDDIWETQKIWVSVSLPEINEENFWLLFPLSCISFSFYLFGGFFHFSFIRKFAPIIRLLQRFFVIHFFVDLSVELPLFEMGKTGVPHPKNNYNLIPTYKNDISSKV